jgi:hypothetical protein
LQSNDVDASLVAASDGSFVFAEAIPSGEAYQVTVVSSPRQHACLVEAGGTWAQHAYVKASAGRTVAG